MFFTIVTTGILSVLLSIFEIDTKGKNGVGLQLSQQLAYSKLFVFFILLLHIPDSLKT